VTGRLLSNSPIADIDPKRFTSTNVHHNFKQMEQMTKILIVGGGIGGMATAIRFRQMGVAVEMIDIDPDWKVYGAGITITGPTLRAYQRLGLLEDIRTHGAITSGTRIFRFDGLHLRDMDEPALEEGLPATGGIMRPVLHKIMQGHVKTAGASVRLGITVAALVSDAAGVDVTFSDGQDGRYDLVVGADGIYSGVRKLAFPHAVSPAPTGQGCWRISTPRPPALERGEMYFGGAFPAGITPCGPDAVYLWMLTPHTDPRIMADAELRTMMRDKMASFGGSAGWMRDQLNDQTWINYRPLEAAIQPGPWHMGRVVLVGDAAHATTPHLASGAGAAVEDALVLAEELSVTGRAMDDCLSAYTARRYERCRDVVETSIAVGKLQLGGGSPEQIGSMIGGALHRLAADF
jgi:2-polyprenyl-6-methoxyphenol hydroxylase-like FAD-dependent oxidoreductase